MTTTQKLVFTSFITLTLLSCNQKDDARLMVDRSDSLMLTILFEPALLEKSELVLLKTDSIKMIRILVRNDFRADRSQDTFWYKKVALTDKQYAKLDSNLLKWCAQKIVEKKHEKGIDGILISSLLVNNGDTNFISFLHPYKSEDSVGYSYTMMLLKNLKNTFQDSLLSEYFDDVEAYIDESKVQRPDSARKIDRLRMKKYKWTLIDSPVK